MVNVIIVLFFPGLSNEHKRWKFLFLFLFSLGFSSPSLPRSPQRSRQKKNIEFQSFTNGKILAEARQVKYDNESRKMGDFLWDVPKMCQINVTTQCESGNRWNAFTFITYSTEEVSLKSILFIFIRLLSTAPWRAIATTSPLRYLLLLGKRVHDAIKNFPFNRNWKFDEKINCKNDFQQMLLSKLLDHPFNFASFLKPLFAERMNQRVRFIHIKQRFSTALWSAQFYDTRTYKIKFVK